MVSRFVKGLACAVTVLAATGAWAQQTSENQVAAKTDWAVFEDQNPKECWAVSSPKETVNTRDGRVVAARRGKILLMAFYKPDANKPDANVKGQIGFAGGYPFATESTVNLTIDGSQFELFTDGEWAWPASAEDDGKIIASMKRGSGAVLVGRSGRGTETRDTFSLLGFTAAVEEAEKRCN